MVVYVAIVKNKCSNMSRFQLGEHFIYTTFTDGNFTGGIDAATFVGAIRHVVTELYGLPEYVANATIRQYSEWGNVVRTVNLQNLIEVLNYS